MASAIRDLADALGLRDWHFEYQPKETPADEDSIAEIRCAPGQRWASIRLDDEFFTDRTPLEQIETLVHELLHCHMVAMKQYACEVFENQEACVAYALFEEYCVDAIAIAVAPLLAS